MKAVPAELAQQIWNTQIIIFYKINHFVLLNFFLNLWFPWLKDPEQWDCE